MLRFILILLMLRKGKFFQNGNQSGFYFYFTEVMLKDKLK